MKITIKYNKNISLKLMIVLLMVLPIFQSCQERLDEMNQNPNALTELPAAYLFTNAVRGTFRADVHRIHADFGAQYAHMAVSESWDRSTDTYDIGHLRGDVTQGVFSAVYRDAIRYCNDISTLTAPGGTQENEVQFALNNIVKVLNFAKLTDMFGDIPYFEGGLGKQGVFMPKYDKQEDIYADMVERLSNDINLLKGADFASDAFPGADPIYNNDKDKWLRFANSFRLRLAMRARFADETKYNAIIAECLSMDLIEENDQNATLQHWDSEDGSLYNPWYNKYRARYESKIYDYNVSEKFVDWLRVTQDPRLQVMVTKATLSDKYLKWMADNNDSRLEYLQDPENFYMGMRNGLIIEERDAKADVVFNGQPSQVDKWPRKDLSTLSLAVLAKDQPLYFMTAAEIWFLRAEAALFNLGGNNANELYQNGIIRAMEMWGIDATGYLANSPQSSLNGTDEEKFEQISSQMWIAFVPNYIEAWSNIRRTGYPRIPKRVSEELSKGVTDGVLPKRLRYPQTTERNINGTNMQEAIDRMGGDNIDIPVWWDVRDIE